MMMMAALNAGVINIDDGDARSPLHASYPIVPADRPSLDNRISRKAKLSQTCRDNTL
jgi:hypothetical protein